MNLWRAEWLISLYVFVAVTAATATEIQDCQGGCANAVVREIPTSARRPYSKDHLTSFSFTQPFIPPLKYDVPYSGKYTVTRVNEKEIRLVCPLPLKGHVVLACAHLDPCNIYMLNDVLLHSLGWNYDIVLRHEIAHCNGWPFNHPGIERPT